MSTKVKPYSVVKSRISPNVKKRLIASGKVFGAKVSSGPKNVAIQPALPDSPIWRTTFFGKDSSLNKDKVEPLVGELEMLS